MNDILELVLRFLVVGAVAFGGGSAALPLVERITVADTRWLTPEQFAMGVGFAYATPGPVLILAAYVGFLVSGIPGAVAATGAVFAVPVVLAAGSSNVVMRLNRYPRFRAFGRFAGAAAVGLLAVTITSLARPIFDVHPVLLGGALAIFAANQFGAHPIVLLVVTAVGGAVVGVAVA